MCQRKAVATMGMMVAHGKSPNAAWAVLQVKAGLRFLRTPSIARSSRGSDSLHAVPTSVRVDFHPSVASRSVPLHIRASLCTADTPNVEYSHRTPIVTHAPHTSIAEPTDHRTEGPTRDSRGRATHPFCGGVYTRGDRNIAEFRVRLGARELVVVAGIKIRHAVPFAGRSTSTRVPVDIDER